MAADVLYGRDAWSFGLMQFPPGGAPFNKAEPYYENETLVEAYAALVRRGDSMLIDAWYNNSVNMLVAAAYNLANKTVVG